MAPTVSRASSKETRSWPEAMGAGGVETPISWMPEEEAETEDKLTGATRARGDQFWSALYRLLLNWARAIGCVLC